jgi:hypothetical protein
MMMTINKQICNNYCSFLQNFLTNGEQEKLIKLDSEGDIQKQSFITSAWEPVRTRRKKYFTAL